MLSLVFTMFSFISVSTYYSARGSSLSITTSLNIIDATNNLLFITNVVKISKK